ncbi:MAG: MarR family transcriptional regulator [Burkholderiaceae bacterium]
MSQSARGRSRMMAINELATRNPTADRALAPIGARASPSKVDAAKPDPELDRLLAGFELTDIASHLLRRAHFRAEELFAAEIGALGLTPRQKALLIVAYRHPGSNQGDLADRIAVDRNTFAEMLARMVKSGLLRRSPDPEDGRAKRVFITDRGIDLLKRVMPLDRRVEQQVMAPLSPEYRPLFLKCLRMMVGIEGPGVDSSEAGG